MLLSEISKLLSSKCKILSFSAVIYGVLGSPGDQVWIGVSDIQKEGYFVFIDGEPATSSNTGWASDEPNNDDNEDCGGVNSKSYPHNTLNDGNCGASLYALCEKPVLC